MQSNRIIDNPGLTRRTLNSPREHSLEWQLCFTLEDITWGSLKKRHNQQRLTSFDKSPETGGIMNLLQQQAQDIREWKNAVEKYRNALHASHGQETLNLDQEKLALAAFL
jgi:hypothetical protein